MFLSLAIADVRARVIMVLFGMEAHDLDCAPEEEPHRQGAASIVCEQTSALICNVIPGVKGRGGSVDLALYVRGRSKPLTDTDYITYLEVLRIDLFYVMFSVTCRNLFRD